METICLVLRGVGSLLKQDKVVRGEKKVTSNCMLDKIVLTLSAGGVHSENLLPEVPRRKGRNLEKKRNLKEEKKCCPLNLISGDGVIFSIFFAWSLKDGGTRPLPFSTDRAII